MTIEFTLDQERVQTEAQFSVSLSSEESMLQPNFEAAGMPERSTHADGHWELPDYSGDDIDRLETLMPEGIGEAQHAFNQAVVAHFRSIGRDDLAEEYQQAVGEAVCQWEDERVHELAAMTSVEPVAVHLGIIVKP